MKTYDINGTSITFNPWIPHRERTYQIGECAFDSRAEYLQWRVEWRDSYQKLSDAIREGKRQYTELQRQGESARPPFELRLRATLMLEIRLASKRQAQRVYLRSRKASAA